VVSTAAATFPVLRDRVLLDGGLSIFRASSGICADTASLPAAATVPDPSVSSFASITGFMAGATSDAKESESSTTVWPASSSMSDGSPNAPASVSMTADVVKVSASPDPVTLFPDRDAVSAVDFFRRCRERRRDFFFGVSPGAAAGSAAGPAAAPSVSFTTTPFLPPRGVSRSRGFPAPP